MIEAGLGHVSRNEGRAVGRCGWPHRRLLVGDAFEAVAEEFRIKPKDLREGRDSRCSAATAENAESSYTHANLRAHVAASSMRTTLRSGSRSSPRAPRRSSGFVSPGQNSPNDSGYILSTTWRTEHLARQQTVTTKISFAMKTLRQLTDKRDPRRCEHPGAFGAEEKPA